MLVQDQSAKLGLATGRNLAQLCRERCSRPVTWVLWAQAELVSIATDLAEVIGGAGAPHPPFWLPPPPRGAVTRAGAVPPPGGGGPPPPRGGGRGRAARWSPP